MEVKVPDTLLPLVHFHPTVDGTGYELDEGLGGIALAVGGLGLACVALAGMVLRRRLARS